MGNATIDLTPSARKAQVMLDTINNSELSDKWPERIFELSANGWENYTLQAGVKLDVFTVLHNHQYTAKEIATKLGADLRAINMLLKALCAMKLLKINDQQLEQQHKTEKHEEIGQNGKNGRNGRNGKNYKNSKNEKEAKGEGSDGPQKHPESASESTLERRYSCTEFGDKFLSKTSENYLGHIILHNHHLATSWLQLDRVIMQGTPIRVTSSSLDEESRENFLMGMYNLAMINAPKIIPQIFPPPSETASADNKQTSQSFDPYHSSGTLLDLGGGPGTYAIHFCKRFPELKATVFDLPTTRPFITKTIKSFNLESRIEFISGDFLTDQIRGKYDIVWLSHILHGEGPKNAELIVNKAVNALKPHGIIFIHEFILNQDQISPLYPTLFSLNMLLGTAAGQAYSDKELIQMLQNNGIKNIEKIELDGLVSSIIRGKF